jgi:parvulin-like peptidyl-prolyl isomerase
MKFSSLALSVCLLAVSLAAQTPAPLPNLSEETVIATFEDGATMTMGEFRRIYAVLPPENQQRALQNRAEFLQQWALMRKLSKLAEAAKLDLLSPSKEALEYNRLMILSQAKMTQAATEALVLPSEVAAFYEANASRYRQVVVKAVYVGFGGKSLTDSGARIKASQIAAQARGGADFVKLVRVHSDDETSRAKNGDFATFRPSDSIPDAVREAVFGLKEGEISDPVRQSNGYYVFRAEKIESQPFAEVRDDIFAELKQKRYAEWVERTNREATVRFNSPAFLGAVPLTVTPGK